MPTESPVAYASAQTVKIVLTEATKAPAITRSTSAQCSRSRTASGSLATPSVDACRVKAGVSWRLRRMNHPTTATATLSQNGIRQPHDSRCSSGSAATGMKTRVARSWPACVPLRVKLVNQPRRSAGACSSVMELALACSPAAETPCRTRHSTSRTGARVPTCSRVGRQPMRNVDRPIRNSVKTMIFLRPRRSPKWPRKNAPTGRAAYATPKVASDSSVALAGSDSSKKTSGKISAAALP